MEENPGSSSHSSGKLLKILGVTFGIAITIGGMIGLGILRTPGLVAAQLPDARVIFLVWLGAAVYALLGTLATAELGSSIKKVGGWYSFARRAMGEYPAFLVGWMDWLAYPIGMAATAITIGEYASGVNPAVKGYEAPIALGIVVGMNALNWIGLRSGSRVQEITSFLKAGVFLILVAACFLIGGPASAPASAPASPMPLGMMATLGAVVIALQGVIYTYDGWQNAAYFAEENEDAGRDLPRAMITGVLVVTAIYLLVNAALLYVLEIPRLASSALPVADAAETVFGTYGKPVVTTLAIISLLSILNSTILVAPRILFALSRDGLFVEKGSEVNAGGTPYFALGTTALFTLILIFIGSFETLLAMSAFMYVVGYLSGFVSLMILRMREPKLHRPFRMPLYPWSAILILVASIAFLIGAVLNDTLNAAYALVMMFLTYPFYLIVKRLRRGAS
jgi:APA family basic amino acid/polyamine antiporter